MYGTAGPIDPDGADGASVRHPRLFRQRDEPPSSTVPGYPGSGTPTNYYPGLIPQDFHLQVVSGGYENWPSISDPYWCTTSVVENQPLLGLCDLAQEPGTINWNFGTSVGNTINKPVFVRFPGRPDLYMDTNGPAGSAAPAGAANVAGGPSTATASRCRKMCPPISAARWRGRFT